LDINQIENNLVTILEYFYKWEKEQPDKVFLRQPYGDNWKTLTYKEAGIEARKMTAFLKEKGLQKGDHIGLLSKNCTHWILSDLAIMMGGFVSVPYYSSLTKSQLNEVILKSDIKLLFVGKLDTWGDKSEAVPSDVDILSFPHYEGNAEVTQGEDWDDCIQDCEPEQENYIPDLDDLWSILFTSGTTGSPKGVMLNYKNLSMIGEIELQTNQLGILNINDQTYFSFLPLNHIAERVAVESACLINGGTFSFAESLESFAKNLQDTQPTFLFAVPRIWTKFHLGVLNKIPQRKIDFLLKIPVVSGIIKKKIRTALGLKNLRTAMTGAAITPENLKRWYKKLDIHLIEVYGMTETTAMITYAHQKDAPLDSVGKAAPYCQIKIDPDSSELLLHTPYNMVGYYKEPEATAEIVKDGWIYSGDRGSLDENGYLRIVGRVKDAFKTAKGSYVTPNPIEDNFMSNDFIVEVCVVGNGMPQPLALINLSEIGLKSERSVVADSVLKTVKNINNELASFECISTVVVTDMWTIDNELITPTMKVRRGKIDDHYGENYHHWHEQNEDIIWG